MRRANLNKLLQRSRCLKPTSLDSSKSLSSPVGRPNHHESERPRCGSLPAVMRAKHKTGLAVLREEQGASQMDRVKRLDNSGHWLACSAQDFIGQANYADGTLRRRKCLVSICHPFIIKSVLQTQTVDCTPCLDAHQLARVRTVPLAPLRQGVPVAKQRAKYCAGVKVDRQRSPRSARSRATMSIRFFSRTRGPTGRSSAWVASTTLTPLE